MKHKKKGGKGGSRGDSRFIGGNGGKHNGARGYDHDPFRSMLRDDSKLERKLLLIKKKKTAKQMNEWKEILASKSDPFFPDPCEVDEFRKFCMELLKSGKIKHIPEIRTVSTHVSTAPWTADGRIASVVTSNPKVGVDRAEFRIGEILVVNAEGVETVCRMKYKPIDVLDLVEIKNHFPIQGFETTLTAKKITANLKTLSRAIGSVSRVCAGDEKKLMSYSQSLYDQLKTGLRTGLSFEGCDNRQTMQSKMNIGSDRRECILSLFPENDNNPSTIEITLGDTCLNPAEKKSLKALKERRQLESDW